MFEFHFMNRKLAGETAPHFIACFAVFLIMYTFGRQNGQVYSQVCTWVHMYMLCASVRLSVVLCISGPVIMTRTWKLGTETKLVVDSVYMTLSFRTTFLSYYFTTRAMLCLHSVYPSSNNYQLWNFGQSVEPLCSPIASTELWELWWHLLQRVVRG